MFAAPLSRSDRYGFAKNPVAVESPEK
jgi:hypothetical protein